MFRVLFLILIVMSSVAFAQEQKSEQDKPKAYIFAELGAATNAEVKKQVEDFFRKLQTEPNSQGYIINYGSDKEVAKREREIRDYLRSRNFDALRITIVRGGTCQILKTELWIVPPGADNPPVCGNAVALNPKPEAYRFEEFGEVSDRFFYNIFNEFFQRVKNEKTIKGYIVMRGTETETAAFENRIRNLEFFQFYNSDRIIFLKKPLTKTQATIALWFAPESTDFSEESAKK